MDAESERIRKDKYRRGHLEYYKLYMRKWRKNNPEKSHASSKKWNENNKEKANIRNKRWHENNIEKDILRHKEHYEKNGEHIRKRAKDYLIHLRNQIYDHYGAYCSCCKESIIEFLTIDHVNGGGSKEKKETKRSQVAFYSHIIKEGFPDKYQILCYNCNSGRYRNGGICPHKSSKKTTIR